MCVYMLIVVHKLKGHLDYSFACAWSPDGRVLATGNQDMTTRLYDVRYGAKSFAVLGGQMGAIRSLRYSSNGRFLAMAEPADFVHLLDTTSDYHQSQLIDFFGEISGISFTPDDESLYIGNSDRALGGLLEFEKANEGVCDMYL
jgi:WD40 repeat protein